MILELTKLIMLRLHYDTFKAFYGARAVLAYTDTDSFIYRLQTTNYLDDFEHINRMAPRQIFDLRDTGRPAPNAGQLGLAKDEAGTNVIAEFVGAQAKMYALKMVDPSGKLTSYLKAKGIPTRDLKRLHRMEDFLDTVRQPNIDRQVQFRAMRSINHQVEHRVIRKRGLTGDNDKVFLLGPGASRPLGHWRNSLPEEQKEENQKRLEVEAAAQWPSLDQDLADLRALREREAAEKKRSRKRKAQNQPGRADIDDQ